MVNTHSTATHRSLTSPRRSRLEGPCRKSYILNRQSVHCRYAVLKQHTSRCRLKHLEPSLRAFALLIGEIVPESRQPLKEGAVVAFCVWSNDKRDRGVGRVKGGS